MQKIKFRKRDKQMSNNNKTVYTVEEVQEILRLGRNSVYNLMKEPPFPIIRIKNLIRIPVSSFNEWLKAS